MDERLIEVVEQNEAMLLANRIEAIRAESKVRVLPAAGVCHSCGEPFDKHDPNYQTRLFCDLECEEDWEEFNQAMKRRYGNRYKAQSAYSFTPPEKDD